MSIFQGMEGETEQMIFSNNNISIFNFTKSLVSFAQYFKSMVLSYFKSFGFFIIATCFFSEAIALPVTLSLNSTDGCQKLTSPVHIDRALPDHEVLSRAVDNGSREVIHLFTHGKPGSLLIEGEWLDAVGIKNWIQEKFQIQDYSRLNIYGCNFAQSEKGKKAVSYLERELGLSIAASINITGRDGDWKLEVGNRALTVDSYGYNLQCSNPTDDCDGDGITNENDRDADNDGLLNTTEELGYVVGSSNCSDSTIIIDDGSTNGPAPESGTAGTVGAIYRFPGAVQPQGHDILIEIVARSSTNAVLLAIDRDNSNPFRADAFRPQIRNNGAAGSEAFFEFQVRAVLTGTNTIVTLARNGFLASDIDGNCTANETTIFYDLDSYFLSDNTDLTVTETAPGSGDYRTASPTGGGNASDDQDVGVFAFYNTPQSTYRMRLGTTNGPGCSNDRQALVSFGTCTPDSFFTDPRVSFINALDTDQDGIPNVFDLDSDNDGILDIIEAGGVDSNNDGEVDYPTPGDPTSMGDANGNGWSDVHDIDDGGTRLPDPDSDGDGESDRVDLDADNDGIPDNVEAQSTTGYLASANDNAATYETNRGINSVYVANPINVVNTDSANDAIPDYLDLDSDNDGIFDINESGGGLTDANNDGRTDGIVGANGFDDAIDTDDDFLDVNGSINNPSDDLDDVDNDVNDGGDVDYRDGNPFTVSMPTQTVLENNNFISVTPTLTNNPAGTITYSLSGADAADFSINPASGVVSMVPRDFENPVDDNQNNFYNLIITANSSGGAFASDEFTVVVNNECEDVVAPENKLRATDPVGDITGDTATLELTITDDNGVPRQGVAVQLIQNSGVVTTFTATGATSSAGMFSTTVSSSTIGDAEFTARYESVTGNGVDTDIEMGNPTSVRFLDDVDNRDTKGDVGINTTTPHPSSVLEVAADDRGMLIPQVALSGCSDLSTIPNPSVSLLVFNTNPSTSLEIGFVYFDGEEWRSICNARKQE